MPPAATDWLAVKKNSPFVDRVADLARASNQLQLLCRKIMSCLVSLDSKLEELPVSEKTGQELLRRGGGTTPANIGIRHYSRPI